MFHIYNVAYLLEMIFFKANTMANLVPHAKHTAEKLIFHCSLNSLIQMYNCIFFTRRTVEHCPCTLMVPG